jgi:hypothetical protein
MVLSKIEKKERARERSRKHYLRNKEKIAEKHKQYKIENKEKIKQYYLANKETISKQKKQYRIENKEKIAEQKKQYFKTPEGKKNNIIGSWKCLGLILPLPWYSILYDYYIKTDRCEVCNNLFKSNIDRHMDHCHETGEFRWILCHSCNNHDYWKKRIYTPLPT